MMPVFVPKEPVVEVYRCRSARKVPYSGGKGNVGIEPFGMNIASSPICIPFKKVLVKAVKVDRMS